MKFSVKTCSMLLCVLEQPIVDNSSAGSLKIGIQLGAIRPLCLDLIDLRFYDSVFNCALVKILGQNCLH
jgi:hypothetical protein